MAGNNWKERKWRTDKALTACKRLWEINPKCFAVLESRYRHPYLVPVQTSEVQSSYVPNVPN